MNIKVQSRQRGTFMVHGVSDEAFMSSPKGPTKVDHGDSVIACPALCYTGNFYFTDHWKPKQ